MYANITQLRCCLVIGFLLLLLCLEIISLSRDQIKNDPLIFSFNSCFQFSYLIQIYTESIFMNVLR